MSFCYLWRRFLENGDRVSVSRGNTEEDAFSRQNVEYSRGGQPF